EIGPVPEGSQEDGPDGRTPPRDRYDGDGLDPAELQGAPHVLQRLILLDVRDEYRATGLDGLSQLRIAVEVHHVVPDARILVAGHESNGPPVPLRQEDRAAIQPECLSQPPRDRLDDVHQVEGPRDFLENLDDGQEALPFVLQVPNLGLKAFGVLS